MIPQHLNLLKDSHPKFIPEVGYLLNYNNEEILFDLVWRNTKVKTVIVMNINDSKRDILRWKIITLGEALDKINEKSKVIVIV